MKYLLALPLLLLTGCASSNIKDVLSNLDRDCVRHYEGAIGGIAQGLVSFRIDCQPNGGTTTTTVTTPVKQP